MGWTADWTTNQGGCGFLIYCQLYLHYVPDPISGHLGSAQTFRLHPGVAAVDDGSIMVGRWDLNTPRFVPKGFFLRWLFNALVPGSSPPVYLSVGPPDGNQVFVPTAPTCLTPTGCVAFQRFSFGYIWQQATQGVSAVFCPDVVNGDNLYRITVSDILAVNQAFGSSDVSLQPYEGWPASRFDVDNSGQITIADTVFVVRSYPRTCYAGG